jgi:hypothetical protein
MKYILVVLFLNTQTGAVMKEYNSYNECKLAKEYWENSGNYNENLMFACIRDLIK